MRSILSALVLTLLTAGLASAGPLPAPVFKPDQHVYTIPANFDPPLIGGKNGQEEIEVTSTPNNRHGEFVFKSTFVFARGRIFQEAF